MTPNWTTIAAVTAGIGSIGSLIAVAWQLRSLARQTREAARQAEASTHAVRASVYMTLQQACIDQDRFFFDHPDLRALFYGHAPGDGSQDQLHRIEAASEMVADLFDIVAAHEEHLPEDAAVGWRAYIREMVTPGTPMHDWWIRNKRWYGKLQLLIEEAAANGSSSAGAASQPGATVPVPPDRSAN